MRTDKVAKVLPLKQGLKLTAPCPITAPCFSSKGSSIKTRIETLTLNQSLKVLLE